MSLHRRGGAMVVEMLTTRRGSGFRQATGSDEEEEVRVAGSSKQRGPTRDALWQQEAEAVLLCADGEEVVGGSSKAEEVTGNNGRQRPTTGGNGGRWGAGKKGKSKEEVVTKWVYATEGCRRL
ncbi:hypothetical protein BHM03_00060844 [Ensete ventricosum]|nr:hypothetical protein BHM03_00060844 [Ensete ventricosum]